MSLEESLSLNLDEAFAGIDQLESRLSGAVSSTGTAFSGVLNAAIDEAGVAAGRISDLIAQGISEGGSTAVAALQEQLSGLTAAVAITLDDAGIRDQVVGALGDAGTTLVVPVTLDPGAIATEIADVVTGFPSDVLIPVSVVPDQSVSDVRVEFDDYPSDILIPVSVVPDDSIADTTADLAAFPDVLDVGLSVSDDGTLSDAESRVGDFPTEIDTTMSVSDDGSIDAMGERLDGLPTEIIVTTLADDSGLTPLTDELEDIEARITDINTTTVGPSADGAGVEEVGGAASSAGANLGTMRAEAAGAGLEMGLLTNRAGALASSLASGGGVRGFVSNIGLGTVAGAAFAGVVGGAMIDSALTADTSIRRFNTTLGENAERVLALRDAVPGLGLDLSELALRNGSSMSSIRDGISTFAQLGILSKATSDQIAQGSQGLVQLAAYVSAANPKLGTAGDLIERLPLLLSRGGPRLARFGIDAGTAAEKAAKGLEIFGKPTKDLSNFEKQYVGVLIALEKVGPTNLAERILGSFDTPIAKIRSLEIAMKRVITEGGKPILSGFVDALVAVAGPAEAVVKAVGQLAGGVFKAIGPEIKILGTLLSWIGDLLDNKFTLGLLTAAGAGLAVYKSVNLAANGINALIKVVGAASSLVKDTVVRAGAAATRVGDAASSGVSTVKTRIGGAGQRGAVTLGSTAESEAAAASFEEVAVAADNAVAATERLAVAQRNAEAAYADLNAVLIEQQALYAEGTAEYELFTTAIEKNEAVLTTRQARVEADLAVTQAEIELKALLAKQNLGVATSIEAELEARQTLAAAQARAVATGEAETVAKTEAATANGGLTVSNGLTAASEEAVAGAASTATGSLVVLNAVEEETIVTTSAMSAVMGVLNPILLGVTVILAAGYAAWSIWGSGAADAAEAANKATDSIHKYADALNYTGTQLANSDQNALRERFQADKAAADELKTSIKDISDQVTEGLEKQGAFQRAGAAVRGDEAAQAATREAFIKTKDVTAKGLVTPEYAHLATQDAQEGTHKAEDAIRAVDKAVHDTFVRTGSEEEAEKAAKRAAAKFGLALADGISHIDIRTGKAYDEFEKEVKANKAAEDAAVSAAKADLKRNDAAQTGNVTYLASIGLLDRLGPAEEGHARRLLKEADALARNTQMTATLATVTDDLSRARARYVLHGAAAIQDGNAPAAVAVAAARALAASDGFAQLDKAIQDATNSVLGYANTAIETAKANGDLVSSTGELAIGMGELESRLDSAADSFVNMLSQSQALDASARSVAKALDEIIPTAEKLGTVLDADAASFDLNSITADNYTEYLKLLPKATQDAIEGRNQAIDKSKKKLEQASRDRPLTEGLIAERFAAGEFVGGLRADGKEDEKAKKSAEQKAAETRAAIAGNQKALDTLARQARDNTRELADFWDGVGVAIRKNAAEMLKAGSSIDEVTAKIDEQRGILIANAREAGFSEEAIRSVLDQERLLPSQVAVDIRATGIDKIVTAIERLATVLAGLADIDPKIANAIRGIQDPTKQVDEFNKAIAGLPKDQQTKLRLIYNVPDPEAFKAEQVQKLNGGAPFKIAVGMGLNTDDALALDQEFANVLSKVTTTVPITPEIVQGVQEFDQDPATGQRVKDDLAKIQNPKIDQAAKDAAKADLADIAKSRDALIKAAVAPDSLSLTEIQLAKAAADRTVHLKTVADGLTPGAADTPGGVAPTTRQDLAQQAAAEFDANVAGTVARLRAIVAQNSNASKSEKVAAQAQLDKIAEARTALIRAETDPTNLTNVNNELVQWAQSHTVHFQTVVDPATDPKGSALVGTGTVDGDQRGGLTQNQIAALLEYNNSVKDGVTLLDREKALKADIARLNLIPNRAPGQEARLSRDKEELDKIAGERRALVKAVLDPTSLDETERTLAQTAQERTVSFKTIVTPPPATSAPLPDSELPPGTPGRSGPPSSVKLSQADADLALAEFDETIAKRKAELNKTVHSSKSSDGDKAKARRELAEIAKERDALVRATVDPASLSTAELRLAQVAQTRTIHYQTIVDPLTEKERKKLHNVAKPDLDQRGRTEEQRVSVFNQRQAVKEFDDATGDKRREYKATIRTSTNADDVREAQRKLDELRAERKALVGAVIDPASLSDTESKLAKAAGKRTVHFKAVLDDGFDRSKRVETGKSDASKQKDDDLKHSGRIIGQTAGREIAKGIADSLTGKGHATVRLKVDPEDKKAAEEARKDLAKPIHTPMRVRRPSKEALNEIGDVLRDWAKDHAVHVRTIVDAPEGDDGKPTPGGHHGRSRGGAIPTPTGGGSGGAGGLHPQSVPKPIIPASVVHKIVAEVDREARNRAENELRLIAVNRHATVTATVRQGSVEAVDRRLSALDKKSYHVSVLPQLTKDYDAALSPLKKALRVRLDAAVDSPARERARAELNRLARARDALMKALVDPGSLTQAQAKLAAWAAQQVLHFRAVIDPVGGVPGFGPNGQPTGAGGRGGKQQALGGDPIDPLHVARGTRITRERGTNVYRLPAQVDKGRPYGVRVESHGNTWHWDEKAGQWVAEYAEGGVTTDIDDVLKRIRAATTAQAGLHAPGVYQFAEPSTQGEYLIPRDPAQRPKARALVAAAASDLGVNLAPQSTQSNRTEPLRFEEPWWLRGGPRGPIRLDPREWGGQRSPDWGGGDRFEPPGFGPHPIPGPIRPGPDRPPWWGQITPGAGPPGSEAAWSPTNPYGWRDRDHHPPGDPHFPDDPRGPIRLDPREWGGGLGPLDPRRHETPDDTWRRLHPNMPPGLMVPMGERIDEMTRAVQQAIKPPDMMRPFTEIAAALNRLPSAAVSGPQAVSPIGFDRPSIARPEVGGTELAAAARQLSAVAGALRSGQGASRPSMPSVNIESLTVAAPDPDLATSNQTIRDVRTAIFTADH